MATDRQIDYLKRLAAEVGEPLSEQELEEFSQMPVKDASDRITQLEQKRDSLRTESTADTGQPEEPE